MNALRQLGLRACRSRLLPSRPGPLASSIYHRDAVLLNPRSSLNLNPSLRLRHLSSSSPRHVQYVRFGEEPSNERGSGPNKSNADRKREVAEKVAIGLIVLGGVYYVVQ
jgi:hypothetical protein